ncbi:MAG: heme-binding protein [Pseudomonadota bacterium]
MLYAVLIVSALLIALLLWVFVFQDIETPAYRVTHRHGAMELRDYPSMVVAEVRTAGSRRKAVQRGFRPLAAYIFASGRPGPRIAMTAPVTQRRLSGARDWVVRFIIPAEHQLADLPRPGPRHAVQLAELPPARRAALRFSGVATDARLAEAEGRLRSWLRSEGLPAEGPAEFAYYNDPMTPGFMRRNEVIVDLE